MVWYIHIISYCYFVGVFKRYFKGYYFKRKNYLKQSINSYHSSSYFVGNYFLSINVCNNGKYYNISFYVIYIRLIGRNNCMLRVITYPRQTFIKTQNLIRLVNVVVECVYVFICPWMHLTYGVNLIWCRKRCIDNKKELKLILSTWLYVLLGR